MKKPKKPKCDCANVIGRNQVCDICQGAEKYIPESFDKAVKDIEEGKTIPLDTALNEEPPTESETFKKICKEIQELFDKIDALELRNHVLTVANEDLDRMNKKLELERDEYKIGHDRYEKLRRLNPREFKELYEKNLTSGTSFDILVDKLSLIHI